VRDEVVRSLFQDSLDGVLYGEDKKYLEEADKLATATEHQIINLVEKKARYDLSKFKVMITNLLSGESVTVLRPSDQIPSKWVNELKGLMQAINTSSLSDDGKWRYIYHLLYGTLELTYYKEYPGCTGPAEVKLPIGTIFDHLYACASMINWTANPEKTEGFLVMLDIPGVHGFISASKKVRDLWFSSWLVSAVSWYLIEELVEYVGPDILITPTPRLNAFYYRWLIRKLEEYNYPIGKLKELLKAIHFAKTKKGAEWGALRLDEPIPLIPATSNLILPSYSKLLELLKGRLDPNKDPEDALAEYFYKRYQEFFERLTDRLRNAIQNIKSDELRSKILDSFELMDRYKISHTPPIPLRVLIVDVSKLKKPEDFTDEELKTFLYPLAVNELNTKLSIAKGLRVHGYLVAGFSSFTQERWESSQDYRICTTCGKLPAFFDIPRRRATGSLESYEQMIPEEYRPYFDEGEHLCPYCLIKRIASTIAVSEAIKVTAGEGGGQEYNSLIEKMEQYVQKAVHSTSWYAIYPLLEGLMKIPEEKASDLKNKFEEYAKELEERAKKCVNEYRQDLFRKASGFSKVLGGLVEDLRTRASLVKTLSKEKNVEDGIEGILTVSIPQSIVRTLTERLGYEPPFSAYFALVQGDADSMGALLGGDVEKALSTSFSDLFTKVIQSTGVYTPDELKTIHEEIKKYGLQLKEKMIKLVWPLYHTTISRALILAAIRDIETIYEVFGESCSPIYAGGDDLLAIVSPIYAFRLVQHTRESFSNGDSHHFHIVYFNGIPSAYLPAMGPASRSYSITFRHYKYPLSISLESSAEDINEYSKKSSFRRNAERWNKDAVALSYLPRGGGKLIRVILPLTLPSVPSTSLLNVLSDILFYVLHNSLSASFIYDLVNMHENYDSAAYETGTFESYWKQTERIIRRNLTIRTVGSNKLAEAIADSIAGSLSQNLKPFFGVTISVDDSTHTIAYEISRALWCIMSAIRVKEA